MEIEVKAKGFTSSESNIGNPFSAYRILHIYIYSVHTLFMTHGNHLKAVTIVETPQKDLSCPTCTS